MLKLFRSISEILNKHSDEICTVSTISAVMEGVYQGTVRGAELKKKGDFGLGTFDALDGEMIMLDNVMYRATPDGKLSIPDAKETVAYAAVKFFRPDKQFHVHYATSTAELNKRIDDFVQLNNVMLGIKVTGSFSELVLRAVPRQSEPYPKFADVAKDQTKIPLLDVSGTLVGFRFPQYTGEVGVSGFHFHFVSEDRTMGGHVLSLSLADGYAEIDISRELHAILPDTKAFDCADMHDHSASISAAEKD